MSPSDDDLTLLAEARAARDLLRDRPAAAVPSVAALWAHVRRRPGAVVDFAVERAIRTDASVGKRYRTLMAANALAHAPMALAASSGSVTRRQLGPYVLTLSEGDGPPLLILGIESARPPSMIEAALGEDMVRLDLPEPVAGSAVVALDPAVPDAALLGRLLGDPRSEIFLV